MLARGKKKQYLSEAILALAPGVKPNYEQVNLKDAQDWIRKKYGSKIGEISDSSFYRARLEVVEEKKKSNVHEPERPSMVALIAEHTGQPVREYPVTPNTLFYPNGIVELVRQLKQLVGKLGKQETKELIDILG